MVKSLVDFDLKLSKNCHLIVGYLDDFFLKGRDYLQCKESLVETILLLQKLGFTIHPEKSELDPITRIIFLGFVIDSLLMIVTLPDEKKVEFLALIEDILSRHYVKIRAVASLVGKMVSSLPASLYGSLYYRTIEHDKNVA